MDEQEQNQEFSPEMREIIIEGMNTPIEDCVSEEDAPW